MRRVALLCLTFPVACTQTVADDPFQTTVDPTVDPTGESSGGESSGAAEGSSSTDASASATMTTTDATTTDPTTDPTVDPDTGSSESGAPGVCGDGMLSADEVCDGDLFGDATCQTQGFMGGELVCNATCQGFATDGCFICGNGALEDAEVCDGPLPNDITCESQGFTEGTISCDMATCDYDTSRCTLCGDGTAEGDEVCDGADIPNETCESLGLTGGILACTASCQYDVLGCDIPGIVFGSDSGYTGYQVVGLPLPCDDISGTGTATGLTDDTNVVAPMGFTFSMYGTDYTDVNIQSNGILNFGTNQYISYTNSCLPTATAPAADNLYVFWDDLNPGAGVAEVYYQTLGMAGSQRFVVQWDTAHFGGDTVDLMRFQAMFDEATGRIDVCYVDTLSAGNTGDNGAEATSGIQHSSVDGFDFSCDMGSLVDGTLLMYLPN